MESPGDPASLWAALLETAKDAAAHVAVPLLPITLMKARPPNPTESDPHPAASWVGSGCTWEDEKGETPDFSAVSRAIEKRVVGDPLTGKLVRALQRRTEIEATSVERCVVASMQLAANRHGTFPTTDPETVTNDIVGFLRGEEFGHRTIFWLLALRVDVEMELFPGFRVRPLTYRDLDYRTDGPYGMIGHAFMPRGDSLAEFGFVSKSMGYAQEEEQKALRFLRLMTGASVSSTVTEHRTRSPISPTAGWGRSASGRDAVNTKVRISVEDCARLANAWKRIHPLMFDPRFDNEAPIGIGWDRYDRTLLEPARADQRNLLCVMGLEALLLDGKDRSQQTRALRERCGLMAEMWGLDSLSTFATVKRAYEARSRYVHGDVGSPGKAHAEMTADTNSCAELLRRLLVFLLATGTSKAALVRSLDEALISDTKRAELMAALRGPGDLLLPAGRLE